MPRRVAVTVTALTLLTAGAVGGATARASVPDAPASSSLRPLDDLDPVPLPEAVPVLPGPVPMPLVEQHGRPVPMPPVDPGRSAGHLVPEELRRGR